LYETWRRLKTAKKLLRQNYFRKSLTSLFKVPVYFKGAKAWFNRDLDETWRRLKTAKKLLRQKYFRKSLTSLFKVPVYFKGAQLFLTGTWMRLL